MPTYTLTVTTNANDEKGLDYYLRRTNDGRASQTPPKAPWTKTQLLQDVIDTSVQTARREYKDDLRNRVGAAVDAATGAQVTQVATLLGVDENPYD